MDDKLFKDCSEVIRDAYKNVSDVRLLFTSAGVGAGSSRHTFLIDYQFSPSDAAASSRLVQSDIFEPHLELSLNNPTSRVQLLDSDGKPLACELAVETETPVNPLKWMACPDGDITAARVRSALVVEPEQGATDKEIIAPVRERGGPDAPDLINLSFIDSMWIRGVDLSQVSSVRHVTANTVVHQPFLQSMIMRFCT